MMVMVMVTGEAGSKVITGADYGNIHSHSDYCIQSRSTHIHYIPSSRDVRGGGGAKEHKHCLVLFWPVRFESDCANGSGWTSQNLKTLLEILQSLDDPAPLSAKVSKTKGSFTCCRSCCLNATDIFFRGPCNHTQRKVKLETIQYGHCISTALVRFNAWHEKYSDKS